MLSHDLTALARSALLSLEAQTVEDLRKCLHRVAERIQDSADKAAHLEASAVGGAARPVVIDLSDDKVVLFPVVRRPRVPHRPGGAA